MKTKLQGARKARDWSQERLIVELLTVARGKGVAVAERASLKAMISRWENGHGSVDGKYRELFREVYRLTDEDLGFAGDVDTAIPSLMLPKSRSPLGNSDQVLEWLNGAFLNHAKAEPFMGPQFLLPSVQPQLEIVKALCKAASGQTRREAFQVGAQFAEFCGWLYQDIGDIGAANYWTSLALDFAQMDGDPLMVSYVLMRKANIAVEANEPGHSIGLADAALRTNSELPPRIRAASLRVKAHGAAILGDSSEFERSITEASDLAETGASADEPDDPARYCTPSYIQMEEATGLVRLGRHEQALRIFEHGLVSWPSIQRRDLGLCLARMATAYALNSDYGEAVTIGVEASRIAFETGSVRIVRELEQLRSELTRRNQTAVMLELDGVMAGLAT